MDTFDMVGQGFALLYFIGVGILLGFIMGLDVARRRIRRLVPHPEDRAATAPRPSLGDALFPRSESSDFIAGQACTLCLSCRTPRATSPSEASRPSISAPPAASPAPATAASEAKQGLPPLFPPAIIQNQ